ncbi:MAG: insulinase family protein [Candidatus Rokubacteria bacterium]|nr:insulinase family protein [Candidatus Rokubacteria bacterium]MBI3827782.1 insulinase family protein [Candidatus Rokubacteria bacterium]
MSRMVASALVLLVLMGGVACRTARLPATSSFEPPHRSVLPNGVHVVVQPFAASPVVALQLWVKAGSRDEEAAELGLAHYLEHMLFKGTETRPPGSIEREIESVGGRVNAATSLDYTFYHMVLPREHAVAGLDILADISVNAALDETLLEAEKRIVLEEMRRNEDNTGRYLVETLYTIAFSGHVYGRRGIGTPELIRSLTRERLVSFYRRRYVPEAFTVVVVGAVDAEEVRRAVTRSFGRLARTDTARLPLPAAAVGAPKKVDLARAGSVAYLALGWGAPRVDSADTPALDLLVSILGQLRSSRLTASLRDRTGLVTSVAARYVPLEAGGLTYVTCQLDPANVARAEEQILREVERVRVEGVTEAERQRAVTAAEARQLFLEETAEGRARTYGYAETVWRLEDELAYVDRLRAVTREHIHAAARLYLDPQRHVRLSIAPRAVR